MLTSTQPKYRIMLVDFTMAFVPFCLLLGAALLGAELTLDLGFYRTVYTIWATTVLVTPALCRLCPARRLGTATQYMAAILDIFIFRLCGPHLLRLLLGLPRQLR